MNPNMSQPNFELPAPIPASGAETGAPNAEKSPSRPEQAPLAPAGMQPLVPVNPMPAASPMPAAPVQAVHVPSPTSSQGPLVADDNDLIEKEWVQKAKQIVAATKEDPHTQSREISRFKADYLKKRYNKDIKIEEA